MRRKYNVAEMKGWKRRVNRLRKISVHTYFWSCLWIDSCKSWLLHKMLRREKSTLLYTKFTQPTDADAIHSLLLFLKLCFFFFRFFFSFFYSSETHKVYPSILLFLYFKSSTTAILVVSKVYPVFSLFFFFFFSVLFVCSLV